MEILLTQLSLLVNIAILVPVCIGLSTNAPWAENAYGESSPARGILLSVYIAIALVSILLLATGNIEMITGLLLVQIIYKITTPFSVGTTRNPVVISNLLVTVLHTTTILSILF